MLEIMSSTFKSDFNQFSVSKFGFADSFRIFLLVSPRFPLLQHLRQLTRWTERGDKKVVAFHAINHGIAVLNIQSCLAELATNPDKIVVLGLQGAVVEKRKKDLNQRNIMLLLLLPPQILINRV